MSHLKHIVSLFLVSLLFVYCKEPNHIDKYAVNADSLQTLRNGFYAYRHGSVFLNNGQYMLWMRLNQDASPGSIFKITDLTKDSTNHASVITRYKIDTLAQTLLLKKFVQLSKRYKFGHLSIDKQSKLAFSSEDGVKEQYVLALNDSVKQAYLSNAEFRLLENGWFEYIRK